MPNVIALVLIVTVQTNAGHNSGSSVSTMQIGTFDSLVKCQAAVAGSKLIEAPKASSTPASREPSVNSSQKGEFPSGNQVVDPYLLGLPGHFWLGLCNRPETRPSIPRWATVRGAGRP
jgi:hypothetical protein